MVNGELRRWISEVWTDGSITPPPIQHSAFKINSNSRRRRKRYPLVPVHIAHVDALGARLIDDVVGEAAAELFERDPGFETGERGAEAEVDSLAKAQGDGNVARDVETVGIGKLALVAVGGGGEEQDAGAGGNGDAVPLDCAHHRAALILRRRGVA